MTMQEDTARSAPDTFGLPEYNVNRSYFEIDGANVRMAFGEQRFGQLHWHYCVLMTAEDLLRVAEECRLFAEEAFHVARMMERQRRSH